MRTLEHNATFQWTQHPEAAKWLEEALDASCKKNTFLRNLSKKLHDKTSTRLFDWLDYLGFELENTIEQTIAEFGFELETTWSNYRVYRHNGAQFPRVVLYDKKKHPSVVAFKADSIADFLMMNGLTGFIEGNVYGEYRRCLIDHENDVEVYVVERRATTGMEPSQEDLQKEKLYLECREIWKTRPRSAEDENFLMQATLALADNIVSKVGQNMAAWIVLEVEREYWQNRNTAGQIQKARQDTLGLGWANHDHHTFRSSRLLFTHLVRLFEILGFHCRERFYAGKEAGWGAQVMENPTCSLVLFLDVDLSPEEIAIDFAHHPLPETKQLGTIGLWCALHGDSILKSGMHHLEAQFEFDDLREDLQNKGIKMMDPFSKFDYLKQAFTAGERWPVDNKRIEHLLSHGLINQEQADKFRKEGALGSHMENLQRRDGYKGFNQNNVSFIIQKTDPRLH